MKEMLVWLLLLCNLGFGPAEQGNDPDVPAQDPVEWQAPDPVEWQAPDPVVVDPTTSAWLKENLEHVTLELHYTDPCILRRNTWGVGQLRRSQSCDAHVTADAQTVMEHKDLIVQMLDTPVTVLDGQKSCLDAYIYVALRDDTGKMLFDVAMWGWEDGAVFVNGVPCKEEDVFYDVVLAFLPPDTALEFEEHLEYWAQAEEMENKGGGRFFLPEH